MVHGGVEFDIMRGPLCYPNPSGAVKLWEFLAKPTASLDEGRGGQEHVSHADGASHHRTERS